MATDYTTTEMVESLKKRGLIPESSDKTFNKSELIRFMDEEFRNILVPRLMEVRENYFVEYYDQEIVADQSRYNLPSRAIGMKCKSMFWLNSNGSIRKKLYQVNIDELSRIDWDETSGEPSYFYFIDNYVELLPKPKGGVSGTLRQYYFLRRNRLVETSECGQITQIVGSNVTVNFAPATFSTNQTFDFIKGTPGFQSLAIDQAISGISGTTLTFSSTPPSALAVGDWVALAGESPIAQFPYDLFPVLSQTGLMVALNALNDAQGAEKAKQKRDEMLKEAVRLVGTRSEDDQKTIISADNIGNYVLGSGRGSPWLR